MERVERRGRGGSREEREKDRRELRGEGEGREGVERRGSGGN